MKTLQTFLRGTLAVIVIATVAALSWQARAESTVRYVITGDLKILDPIYTTSAITIGHGYLVYDTLFAMDGNFEPKPQMVESWEVSADGMKYSFTLREGLKWHDGTSVTARDVVASLERWSQKGTDAKLMMNRAESLVAKDDRTFELTFKEKFGPVLLTLANPVIPGFIMREQDAKTPPDQQVAEVVGSGPYVFAKDEWVPGSKIVYTRFADYVPRNEPANGYAGGKVPKIERVEWLVIPDANTAVQALIAGEVDIMEWVPTDLVPLLRDSGDVEVKVTNPLGVLGHLRLNTLHPPFNTPEGRQALLMLVDQDAYNTAAVGTDPALKKTCYAIFGCGSLFETEVGAEPFMNASEDKARALLEKAGYDGRPIIILDPTDWDEGHSYALLTGQALRKAGAKVEVQAMDWSTLSQRRTSKEMPGEGSPGWDIFPTNWPTITMSNPITNTPLVAACADDEATWYGWPCDQKIEALRAEFVASETTEDQKRIASELQKRFYEYVPYVNTGQYLTINAWRKELKGVVPFMQIVFWNMSK